MITVANANSLKKYTVLFKDAWKVLKDAGRLQTKDLTAAEKGQDQFTDLAHYFAYIKDLLEESPDSRYVMMSLDEEPFKIDANSRQIQVPPAFERCSGVQYDNYAEIITFTIDRYFDYKDLAEAEIAVQWINDTTKVEGVSFIQLIDLKTFGDENKIRFGWPLTREMTEKPGNLRFAVRFYTSQTDADNNVAFEYLFNTVEASITIKPTLNVDFNNPIVVKKANDFELFTSYITNSINPSYGVPGSIKFIDTPPNVAFIDIPTDRLTLYAQAKSTDGKVLSYEWHYVKLVEEDGGYKVIEDIALTDEEIAKNYAGIYEVKDFDYVEYKPQNWPLEKDKPIMAFWVEDTTAPTGYKVYEGEWPIYVKDLAHKNELIDSGEIEATTVTTLDVSLWTAKTSLKFLPNDSEAGKNITGQYYVKAINSNGINVVDQISGKCLIAAPKALTITKDLNTNQFLPDKNGNKLTFSVNSDAGKPTRTFNLYNSHSLTPDVPVDTKTGQMDSVTFELGAEEFGYYYIQVDSVLNRHSEPIRSINSCLVTDYPLSPTLKALKVTEKDATEAKATVLEGNEIIVDTNLGDCLELNVDIYQIGESYEVAKKDAQGNPTLEKETIELTKYNTNENGYSYTWYVTPLDGEETIVTANNIDLNNGILYDSAVNGSVLKVRVATPAGGAEKNIYSYRCEVSNTLGSKTEIKNFTFILR